MSTYPFSRRSVVVACAVALSLSCLLMQWASAATLTRVTLPDGGVGQVNNSSHIYSLSANGRYVLFGTDATNVVSGDTNGTLDVFVYDRVTHATVRASLGDDGSQPNRDCIGTDITPDGRYVTFHSAAGNLVAGDTNAKTDVFVRDLVSHHTVRVSVTTAGVQTNQNSTWGELSADGRYVLFGSVGQLVTADTNAGSDIYLRDLVAGTTTLVSVALNGAAVGIIGSMRMTPDARYIAFSCGAAGLVSGYNFSLGYMHIFVRDMVTNTTTVVDLSSQGELSNDSVNTAQISADGRYVSLETQATNLVPGSVLGISDIYLRDRQTGTTSRVSVNSQGARADGISQLCTLSADGRYIAFDSYATNLVPNDTNGVLDVFLRDNVTGAVRRISVSNNGLQTNGPIYDSLYLSYDGLQTAFTSEASNLVSGDTNGKMDGFLYERTPPSLPASLSVSPAAPVYTSNLVATASGSVDSVETPTYQYEWSKLGGEASGSVSKRTPVGRKALQWGAWGHASTDGALTGVTLLRGDVWRVHALATDGADTSDWTAPVEVTIGDTAPGAPTQLTIAPTDPLCTSNLVATAGGSTDPDTGDTVSYKYQWMLVTGVSSARKSATARKGGGWGYDSTDGALVGVTLHKGEVWAVHACATDGTLDSAWSSPVEVTIGNSAPAVPSVLTISPDAPVCTSSLVATADGTDPDGDTVSYKYQWALVTAAPSGRKESLAWGYDSTDGALTGVTLHKGEVWQVHARATDGTLDSAWSEPAQATIGDSIASVPTHLAISPDLPLCTDTLSAAAGGSSDADAGDPVSYKYQWALIAPELAPGKGVARGKGAGWGYDSTDGKLTGVTLLKGQRWAARACATDGAVDSAWCTPVETTVVNSLPAVAQVAIHPAHPNTSADLRVTGSNGTDADGDSLAYAYQWSTSTDDGNTWSAWSSCGRTVSNTLTTRGELWRARCRASDGDSFGPWLISPAVTIANTAPKPPTSVTIAPVSPGPDVDLMATADGSNDADPGDTVTYQYKWRRSRDAGATWSAWSWTGATLSAALTVPGQQWQVAARATDGTATTGWRLGDAVTILRSTPPAVGLAMTAATASTDTTAQITLTLTAAAEVQARVLNLSGREVAMLAPQTLPAGVKTLLWNGRSSAGTVAPPGRYLVQVRACAANGATAWCVVPLVR